MMKPGKRVEQAAAIALWKGRVCLVTSRSGKRWVIPKGCLEPGKSPEQIVSQEAWEEAGLVGLVQPEPLGSFCYHKAGKVHAVSVHLMHVTAMADRWPECRLRKRRWVRPEKALSRPVHDGLRQLLRAVLGEMVQL
jgi:8-oxo-dGTP pyrophosphatase MutT (NUDIX family)